MRRPPRGRLAVFTVLAAMLLAVLALPSAAIAADGDQPWRDTSKSPDQRAQLLLDAMTLDQKVTLFAPDPGQPIPELGIPPRRESDGCCGINTSATNVTGLPAGLALASTFDGATAAAWGSVVGQEAHLTGQSGVTSPSVDLMRSPFNGRGWESFGEDPLLMGRLAAQATKGVQSNHTYSLAKHFTVNDQETKRGSVNETLDQRTLNEFYVRPWEILQGTEPSGATMCAFPSVNGYKACSNKNLLTDILKGRLNYKGFVSSDYNACTGVESFLRGADVCGPAGGPFNGDDLKQLVQSGELPMARFNDMVFRILRTFFATGVYDDPPPGAFTGEQNQTIDPAILDKNEEVARQSAREGSVLLKNTTNALPIDKGVDSIAVIGSDADAYIDGGGASAVTNPARLTTIYDGIKQRGNQDGVDVSYTKGVDPVRLGDSLPGVMQPVPSDVLTAPDGGKGFRVEYFTNPRFEGTADVTRDEDQLNQRSGLASFLGTQQTPDTPFGFLFIPSQSRRYKSTLTPTQSGNYTFSISHLGTARMYVNGEEVINSPSSKYTSTATRKIALKAGQQYDIGIEYIADAPNTFAGGLNDAPFPMMRLDWKPPSVNAVPGIKAAVAQAKASDVAVLVARDYIGEQADRGTLALGQSQDQLIKAVAAVNPRTVVVLATSGPVLMPWLNDVEAVLEAWYPGEAQGKAVADLLYGDYSPTGKLPVTFPASDKQSNQIGIPNPFDQIQETSPTAAHNEGVNVGYRGYSTKNITPLFPFGYGLSYSSFAYSSPRVSNPVLASGNRSGRAGSVSAFVRNTGSREATETVQVYSGPLPGPVATPARQLIGYAKVTLAPGARQRVQVPVNPSSVEHPLSYFDAGSSSWVTPTGNVPIYIGGSSSDTPLTTTMTLR